MVLMATGVPVRLCSATATRPKVPAPTTLPTSKSDMSSDPPRYDFFVARRGASFCSCDAAFGSVPMDTVGLNVTSTGLPRVDGSAVIGRNVASTPAGGNETRRGTFSLPNFFFFERSSLLARSGSLATAEGVPAAARAVSACVTRQPVRSRAAANAVPPLEPSGASNMSYSIGSSRSSRAT